MKKAILVLIVACMSVGLFGIWPFSSKSNRVQNQSWNKREVRHWNHIKKNSSQSPRINEKVYYDGEKENYIVYESRISIANKMFGNSSKDYVLPVRVHEALSDSCKDASIMLYAFYEHSFKKNSILESDQQFIVLNQMVQKVILSEEKKGQGIGFSWEEATNDDDDIITLIKSDNMTAEIKAGNKDFILRYAKTDTLLSGDLIRELKISRSSSLDQYTISCDLRFKGKSVARTEAIFKK
jgi:hypothetical protein